MSEKTDHIVKELGYEPAKSKVPQKKNVYTPQGRDAFQTPNYAVDLLVPFIPKLNWIWECACGQGKILHRLLEKTNLDVYGTDIIPSEEYGLLNFLTETLPQKPFDVFGSHNYGIITNPPFSLKEEFYKRCIAYCVPFALLIPADYNGWIIKAIEYDGAEKIIPTRRIDYITPSGLTGNEGHTADFHSMWLTWGFGLGKTETFVELSLEDKKSNI